MSRGSNVAAHVVVIISHLFVPLTWRSKVLPFGFSQINLENLSLIRTIGFAEGTFVDLRSSSLLLGIVQVNLTLLSLPASVRNSKINASIILLFSHLFVPLTYRSKVLSLGSKNKYEFILYFARLFVPLSASSGVHG